MLDKCCASTCKYLKDIGKRFCSIQDLKVLKCQDLFQHFSALSYDECEQHQEKLFSETIENPLNLKFPVRKSYQASFLKHCISQAEELNLEFALGYEYYIKLLNENSTSEETSYKHYFIGEKVLTLKENNNFISGGTTGLCTWQAGIALANWCLYNYDNISSKQVVELGCGSGLTGIALLNSSLPPREYIFTDYHPLVLQQLRENLDINVPGEIWPRSYQNTLVNVCEFDWSSESNLKNFEGADVILGAEAEKSEVWVPPRSPYSLIQEDLYSNPWQLLVATIFLTKTPAAKAIPEIHKFLQRWPTPEAALSAEYEDIYSFFSPLGLGHTRTRGIIRFSREYLQKNWKYPIELYGIGKYGNDSYRMFCVNEWRKVKPDDIPLTMYRNWLLENEKELGL